MFLVKDGKCCVCGKTENLVMLIDHTQSREHIVICKDHLIEALITFFAYDKVKMLVIEKKYPTVIDINSIDPKFLDDLDLEVSNLIRGSINDLKMVNS